MKPVARTLVLRSSGASIRTATYADQEYLVVPVVALVEGVIWPVNAKSPELVLAEEYRVAPEGWNGRPVFCGHPVREGTQVSGNTPEILEQERVGWVFNSSIQKDRLTMEAWVDPTRCNSVGGDAAELLERVRSGADIEISTGVLVLMENKTGVYGNKKFNGIWRNITPDHLALLPEGDIGACSIDMGCGVRAAARVHLITAKGIEYQKGGDFVAEDTTDKNKSKKKNRRGSLKARLSKVLSTLQGTPQEEAAEEAAELVQWTTISTMLEQAGATVGEAKGIVAQLISDETENPTEGAAEEDAEETVENARLDALYALAGSSIDSLYKVLNLVSQCLMDDLDESDDYRYAKGARNSKIDQKTIQQVHDNSTALGASCDPEMKASSAADCGCKERNMERKDRIAALLANKHNPIKEQKALETLTDDGLKTLEASCTTAAEAETRTATEKAETDRKIAELQTNAAKPITDDDARLPESMRAMVSKYKAAESARKTELVGKLKTAQAAYTEAELNTMDVDALEKLAKVAKLDVAAAVVDFSGRSVPRAQETASDEVPAPPSLVDGIRTSQGKKTESAA